MAACLAFPNQVERIAAPLLKAGFQTRGMPYSAMFSSPYGSYRQAVRSGLGASRKAYQIDYDDPATALAQVADDVTQGAAAAIVKPSMLHLDVLAHVCRTTAVPVTAYHVTSAQSIRP